MIVAPVDLSPTSEAAAAHARWLAGRLGARLRLLHVLGPGPEVPGPCAGGPERAWQPTGEARRRAERDLEALADRLAGSAGDGSEVPIETEIVTAAGSPGGAIVEAARRARADLIVMATHGRTTLRRLLLGSVAEQVVCEAHCPVLTVK